MGLGLGEAFAPAVASPVVDVWESAMSIGGREFSPMWCGVCNYSSVLCQRSNSFQKRALEAAKGKATAEADSSNMTRQRGNNRSDSG